MRRPTVRASGGGLVCPAGDHGQLLDTVYKLAAGSAQCAQLAAGYAFAQEYLIEAAAMAAYDMWIGDLATRRRPRRPAG